MGVQQFILGVQSADENMGVQSVTLIYWHLLNTVRVAVQVYKVTGRVDLHESERDRWPIKNYIPAVTKGCDPWRLGMPKTFTHWMGLKTTQLHVTPGTFPRSGTPEGHPKDTRKGLCFFYVPEHSALFVSRQGLSIRPR